MNNLPFYHSNLAPKRKTTMLVVENMLVMQLLCMKPGIRVCFIMLNFAYRAEKALDVLEGQTMGRLEEVVEG